MSSDVLIKDSDGDTIWDGVEVEYQLNPLEEDTDKDGILDDKELELVLKYLPKIIFDSDELYYPTTVDFALDPAHDVQYVSPAGVRTLLTSWSQIVGRDGYLEYPGLPDDYLESEHYLNYYAVYPRVINRTLNGQEFYVVQFWLHYVNNYQSINKHIGEWEMFEVIVHKDPDGNPNTDDDTEIYGVGAMHHYVRAVKWDDIYKGYNDAHLWAYPAKSGHGTYFKPGSYDILSSPIPDVNIGSDENDGGGRRIGYAIAGNDFDEITLVGELYTEGNHLIEQDWLEFIGRWGQKKFSLIEAPQGPATKGAWREPIIWEGGVSRDDNGKDISAGNELDDWEKGLALLPVSDVGFSSGGYHSVKLNRLHIFDDFLDPLDDNDGDIGSGEIYIEVSKDGVHWRRIFGVVSMNDGETVDVGQYIVWKGDVKLYFRVFDDDKGVMERLVSGEYHTTWGGGWKEYTDYHFDPELIGVQTSHMKLEFTEVSDEYLPGNKGYEVNYLI